jgi:DMSO/TMAO reductase YedYZ molybdopterin-dependent catalytic subunit
MMMKRLPTNAIKGTLGLFMLLTYLSGCAQFTGVTNVPSETPPVESRTQAVTPTPPEPPTSATTMSIGRTPQAEPGTDSAILQKTGAATALSAEVTPGACQLSPVTQPPQPVKTYYLNELDGDFGLHVTGRPQWIDIETYRLEVTGLVDHPLSLTYDELRCMPNVTSDPTLICPGVFEDEASWTGVPLKYILELAGVQQGANTLTLVSADGYEVRIPLDSASADKNFLAYEVNGEPLPVQHGFPLRAVFPSFLGSYWLKWLIEIRIS